jgi:S-adenosyl methyltransferase
MYDYYLGGKDNFDADRQAAERFIAMLPDGAARTAAAQNRQFLVRAVRHLADDLGVRQFLDIGSGLPTVNNVHEVAQSIAPESRVVYVDHDPEVIAHGRALLHGNHRAAIFRGDARRPTDILADPAMRSLLDFRQPVAVLLVALLHFLSDSDDPYGVVRALMNAAPVGSYLILSHFTADSYPRADDAALVYRRANSSLQARTRAGVAGFFAGYDLLAPGEVVWPMRWRPDADTGLADKPGQSLVWCGVARKSRPGPAGALPVPQMMPAPERLSKRRPAGRARSARLALPAPTARPAPVASLRPDVPNVARMYDYMLGGKDNYPADREAVQRGFAVSTEAAIRGGSLQNRRFLGRAVRYLARDAGIRQFLDIGTGLPTMNNVHEVAHAIAPDARVAYVDNDPVVIAHARDMLNGVPNATIADGDLRDPAGILADPAVRSLLDFELPVAVLLVAVLHFITDDEDPSGIVRVLMDAVPAGSYLVVSHVSADGDASVVAGASAWEEASSRLRFRTRAEVGAMLNGFSLVDPGELVWTPQWHPDEQTGPLDGPGGASMCCAVARK